MSIVDQENYLESFVFQHSPKYNLATLTLWKITVNWSKWWPKSYHNYMVYNSTMIDNYTIDRTVKMFHVFVSSHFVTFFNSIMLLNFAPFVPSLCTFTELRLVNSQCKTQQVSPDVTMFLQRAYNRASKVSFVTRFL